MENKLTNIATTLSPKSPIATMAIITTAARHMGNPTLHCVCVQAHVYSCVYVWAWCMSVGRGEMM